MAHAASTDGFQDAPVETSPDQALTETDAMTRTVPVADGRSVGLAEYGDPDGHPVFFFHGWPGSRMEPGYFEFPGLRLIALDRSGYGLSDPVPNRHLTDWPKDVEAVADQLGLEQFGIVGISGGGPYAAACAHELADRVTLCTLICPLGPPDAPGMEQRKIGLLKFLGRRPRTGQMLFQLMRRLLLHPRTETGLARLRQRMRGSNPDAKALDFGFSRFLVRSWQEAVRNSHEGMASDARVYAEPWPFTLEDIAVPVRVWHGMEDPIVPDSIGRHYAARIPNARATYFPNDGHVSIIRNHLDTIIADIVAAHR